MAEVKFICPHCNQKISCDELWGGHQLQCPACQREVTVPQSQAAPPPAPAPAPAPTRVTFQPRGSAAALVPPPPPGSAPKLTAGRVGGGQAAKPVYREIKTTVQKKGGVMKWVTIGAVVIALGVGGYFGYGWLSKYQEGVNAKRRQAEKNSDGGEMGHIANVYEVLDKTDPDRAERSGSSRTGVPRPPRTGSKFPPGTTQAAVGDTTNSDKELPVIPAVWTLDLEKAKIPESHANGKISGTNFVVETASLGIVGSAQVLSLRQGAAASPDREMLVYLHPKAGESLTGHVWTVSKDMKGAGVPQVAKRWKTNPKFAPSLKTFPAGYAMKLEFGQITDNEIFGKIFLALPDAEQSVVAGVFKATTSLTSTASPTAPTPAAPAPKMDPEFQKRYGIKR